jgi:hypothetical protein
MDEETAIMTEQREISGKAFVRDLHAGMTDSKLMAKYKLSHKELETLFRQLLDAGIMKSSELYGRTILHDYALPTHAGRILPREDIDFPLAIFDSKTRSRGYIRDLSAEGVGIKGLPARVEETKRFVVPASEFFGAGRVVIEAQCRWIQREPSSGEYLGGFRIVKVVEGSMNELLNCIGALSHAERAVLKHRSR